MSHPAKLAVLAAVAAVVFALTACQPHGYTVTTATTPPAPPASSTCPTDGTVYVVGTCTFDPSVMPSGLPAGTRVFRHPANFEAPEGYPPGVRPDGTIAMTCPPGVTDWHLCTPDG